MKEKVSNIISKVNRETALTVMCFAFFVFTMMYRLTYSSLWWDEWIEFKYSQFSFADGKLYEAIISTFQPPLYNWIMHFWLMIGQSIFWFRFFNVLIGTASGIFLYIGVKALYSKKAALISLCVLACTYEWIYCIQECSEYALMLFFLFMTLMFFSLCMKRYRVPYMIGLVLASVGAMYSQYGAVFVVAPILLYTYYIVVLGDRFKKPDLNVSRTEENRDFTTLDKILISGAYVAALIFCALPLYLYYLRYQLNNNQASDPVSISVFSLLKGLFVTLGRIILYFWHLTDGIWNLIGAIMSIGILVTVVLLFWKGHVDRASKGLLFTLAFSYVLHYFLVRLQLYAMVHPNQSGGFYIRYSYFYIPLLCFAIPVLIKELQDAMAENHFVSGQIQRLTPYFAGAMALCVILSAYTTLQNWHKAYDNVYSRIWMEHEGWKDTTYLVGISYNGFWYYIPKEDGYQPGYMDKAVLGVEEELADSFWIWRTNVSETVWQDTVDKARDLGYLVTVYDDHGYEGQLAYCTLEAE